MMRSCYLIGLLLFFVSGVPDSAGAQPSLTARTETIDVAGQAMMPLSGRYQRLERVFRRFDSFPAPDREGLTLHMAAKIEPGDRPGFGSGLMMRRGNETIRLIPEPGSDIVFPRDAGLWMENPTLYARLKSDETLSIGFFFSVTPQDKAVFTQAQARHWLGLLDRCIEDEGGYLIALLLPDTHKLSVDIAPGSRFEVVQDGASHLLVDNQGTAPYRFVFRPQDYRRDAVFRASAPFVRIVMHLPFPLHGALRRK